jgi:hypothetical protein
MWRARWDLNPGSPAPQASVLIQPRLRAPSTRLLYSDNINADVKGKIINTLLKLKNNGLEEQTVKIVGFYLNHLAVNVDLGNPERVKEFIANKNVNSGFKGNLVKAYNYYALVNNIVWERPRYRWEQNKPKIPSEETLSKIIAPGGWKYSALCGRVELSRTGHLETSSPQHGKEGACDYIILVRSPSNAKKNTYGQSVARNIML